MKLPDLNSFFGLMRKTIGYFPALLRVVRSILYYCHYIINNNTFNLLLYTINFATSLARYHPPILVSKYAIPGMLQNITELTVQSARFPLSAL